MTARTHVIVVFLTTALVELHIVVNTVAAGVLGAVNVALAAANKALHSTEQLRDEWTGRLSVSVRN